jgi:hypothetical protein
MEELWSVAPDPPPPPPPDPNLVAEQQQAQTDLINGLQKQTQGDMASLMARYGTQLALAGTFNGATTSPGSPLSSGFSPAIGVIAGATNPGS